MTSLKTAWRIKFQIWWACLRVQKQTIIKITSNAPLTWRPFSNKLQKALMTPSLSPPPHLSVALATTSFPYQNHWTAKSSSMTNTWTISNVKLTSLSTGLFQISMQLTQDIWVHKQVLSSVVSLKKASGYAHSGTPAQISSASCQRTTSSLIIRRISTVWHLQVKARTSQVTCIEGRAAQHRVIEDKTVTT